MAKLSLEVEVASEEAKAAIEAFANDVQDAIEKTNAPAKKHESTVQRLTASYIDFKNFASDAIQGVQKIWEFGKEGAQIELQRQRFDRLAQTIGTTADALKNDLGDATKGMLSNAEQVQMGTDLMSLGLATTHDQVVRLSGVAAGLNMDMNQLVLTLANQTTMRFDQLGVSIDGFDKRLKKLKDSGMDANAAFTEAFLEQAEDQMKRLGDASETTAGNMKKAEAAIKDVGDRLKEVAAEGINAGIQLLTFDQKLTAAVRAVDLETRKSSGSYDDYALATLGAAQAAGILTQAQQDEFLATGRVTEGWNHQYDITQYIIDRTGVLTRAQYDAARGYDEADRAARRSADAKQQEAASLAAAQATQDRYYASLAAAAQAQQDALDREAEKKAAAAAADKIYRDGLSLTIANIDGMAQSLAKATDAQAKQMLAKASLDTLQKAYQDGTISQGSFKRATDEVLLNYDLATPKSLAMAKAQGDVNKAFLDGNMTLADYITATEKIPEVANDGEISMKDLATLGVKPTTDAVKEQMEKVGLLKSEWDKIPTKVTTTYTIQTNGSLPGVPGTTPTKIAGKAGGGLVNEGLWYLHNDEVVLNRSQRMGYEPIPAGWAPGVTNNLGGVSIAINAAPGQNVQELARAVSVELGRMTRARANAGRQA